MKKKLRFLIVDGYPPENREQFTQVGMKWAAHLYRDLLLTYVPDAEYHLAFPSDPGVRLPDESTLRQYHAVLWTGCSLTVYHEHDARVIKMLDLVKLAYKWGVPQFGSCWGAQIAVYAAGGKVEANPKGREMGLGRKIFLTEEGRNHPMYKGKPLVFDGFISHDDHITELPPGAKWLASNSFSRVQAVAVEHENGVFWATQYHPEYNLYEMARLIIARAEKLIKYNFFKNEEDLQAYVEKMQILATNPDRKDLRWQLAIDEDVLDDSIRHCEFINWLQTIVFPKYL